MTTLLVASALFFLTHIGFSLTGLRDALRDRLGANAYLGVYSIVALGTLGFAIYAYIQADKLDFIWIPGPAERGVTYALMMVSLIFMVGGVMGANPTQVGQEKKLSKRRAASSGSPAIRFNGRSFSGRSAISSVTAMSRD